MKKEKDAISKLNDMIRVDKMTRLVNELKIVLRPYTLYDEGGAWDRELTGKTLEDSKREAKIDLYYYRKYGKR
jgi:hypothetical protein